MLLVLIPLLSVFWTGCPQTNSISDSQKPFILRVYKTPGNISVEQWDQGLEILWSFNANTDIIPSDGNFEPYFQIRYRSGNSNWTITNIRIESCSYYFNNLSTETFYLLQIRAGDGGNWCSWTDAGVWKPDIGRNIDIEAPLNPVNNSGDREINFIWDPVPDIVSYRVEYRKTGDVKWSTQTVNTAECIIPDLKGGSSYEVRVAAVKNNKSGHWSPVLLIRITDAEMEEIPEPPVLSIDQPDGSAVGELVLQWNSVAGASKYKVEYGTDSAFNKSTFDFPSSANTWTAKGLRPEDTVYGFKVYAGNESGWSEPSIPVTQVCRLAKPANVNVTAGNAGQLNVSWDKMEGNGVSHYNIYWNTGESLSGAGKANTTVGNAGITTYTIRNLNNDTEYYVWVQVCVLSGSWFDGPHSNAVTGVTL